MERINRAVRAAAVLVAALTLSTSAFAQDYPTKRITFIVGYGAGAGVVDVSARALTDKLERRLGQPVTVEYRPGAQSQIAFEAVNRAAPDGYTLGFATIGLLTLPLNTKAYQLDPLTDLTPVALTTGSANPLVLVGSAKAPFKNLAEFVAYAKANPGRATIGAVGTSMEMEVAMLGQRGGFKATTVPYKGSTQMEGDVMVGDLIGALSSYTSVKSHVESGRMLLLGVGSRDRASNMPNTPSISEAIPGHEITPFWFGVIAPPKTPAAIVNRLSDAIVAGMNEPDVAVAFDKVGLKPTVMNTTDFRAFITREKARFTEAANLIGLKPQ
jgi:tripartite-type tricarboxylate transporter receptor subunit TctC